MPCSSTKNFDFQRMGSCETRNPSGFFSCQRQKPRPGTWLQGGVVLWVGIIDHYYSKNLDGFGNWFKIQAQEERDHAMLFLTYLQNNGECPKLGAIDAPDKVYESFRDPLAASLVHEEYVTSLINAIYAEAMKANDFRTLQFLDWFVKEQGEEEKNANDLLGRFDLFASDVKGLYALDAEMAARTYTAPSLTL